MYDKHRIDNGINLHAPSASRLQIRTGTPAYLRSQKRIERAMFWRRGQNTADDGRCQFAYLFISFRGSLMYRAPALLVLATSLRVTYANLDPAIFPEYRSGFLLITNILSLRTYRQGHLLRWGKPPVGTAGAPCPRKATPQAPLLPGSTCTGPLPLCPSEMCKPESLSVVGFRPILRAAA